MFNILSLGMIESPSVAMNNVYTSWNASFQESYANHTSSISYYAETYGWQALVAWLLAELVFFVVIQFVLYPKLNKLKKFHYEGDLVVLMKRAIDTVFSLKDSYSFPRYLSAFFRGAKFEDIKAENYRSHLAWYVYTKKLHELNDDEERGVEDVFAYTENLHGRKFPEGFNPNISHCAMSLEPLSVNYIPLLFYVVVNVMEQVANFPVLHFAGFQRRELNGVTYWYRKGETNSSGAVAKGQEPVLFLHGISTGWMSYGPFIHALAEKRTILMVEIQSIKLFSLSFHMPSPDEYATNVMAIMDKHRFEKVSLVGHSFGSIAAGWLAKRHPARVSHLTLIDPVSLLLLFPEVCYHFVYRYPTSFMELVIYAVASREITISNAIRREFSGHNNTLWLEDVAPHIGVVVGLSSKDELVPSDAVHEYVLKCRKQRLNESDAAAAANSSVSRRCSPRRPTPKDAFSLTNPSTKSAPIECVMWEGYSHCQFMASFKTQRELIAMMKNNEQVDHTN